MKLPTLSVILPNFNHAEHLPTCLSSLLSQSVPPTEIILIDDGSTDSSVQVIEKFAAQHSTIKFYKNDKNRGVSFTVNRGIDLAVGDYAFFIAADDEVLPGFLEKSLRLLASNPQAGISCTVGDWREIASGLHWFVGANMTKIPAYFTPKAVVELERQGRLFIPNHTAIMKRSALIEAGKFIADLKSTSDWFSNNVLAFRYGLCVIPEPLGVFNIHPNSYYKRIRRDTGGFGGVLDKMVNLLVQPQYADVAKLIKEGGSLYVFGIPMLKLLISRSEYRTFLTARFLRKNAWHCTKLGIKKVIPAALGNLLLKAAGYHKKPASDHVPANQQP